MIDAFWAAIDATLDRIEAERPETFDGVRDVLGTDPLLRAYGGTYTADASFFGGSGGDRSLLSALRTAGWAVVWMDASYFYVAQHPATRELLTYIEGDVYRGDQRPS